MLVKGVTGGKDKGNPIEFTPKEKFPKAVEKFLNSIAEEGKLYLFNKVDIKESSFSKKGLGNKGFSDNHYVASGKVWYKTLDIATDKLYGTKEAEFSIDFEDCVDEHGQPDVKLNSLNLQ